MLFFGTRGSKALVQQARANPRRVYDTPEAVLTDRHLGAGDKRSILVAWQEELTQLSVAQDEGMTGGEPGQRNLQRVTQCLLQLSEEACSEPNGA